MSESVLSEELVDRIRARIEVEFPTTNSVTRHKIVANCCSIVAAEIAFLKPFLRPPPLAEPGESGGGYMVALELATLRTALVSAQAERDARRESLAQEFRSGLRARNLWCPERASDLISAVFKAIDDAQADSARLDWIEEHVKTLDGNVQRRCSPPHEDQRYSPWDITVVRFDNNDHSNGRCEFFQAQHNGDLRRSLDIAMRRHGAAIDSLEEPQTEGDG